MIRLCPAILFSLTFATATFAQDAGKADSVVVEVDSLYTGRSAPVSIRIVNDRAITAFSFPLITFTLDTGFARIDSIRYAGRMSDPSVLNFRPTVIREGNGESPDSVVVTAYKAGGSQLPLAPGNDAVVNIWMTGLILGEMTIDTGFFPPGAIFAMIPYTEDFTGVKFTPQFRAATFKVVESSSRRCGNLNGSVDGAVDVADLTALIDHLFITFIPLADEWAGNVDGSHDKKVDIADLTALIDHLFITFQPLNCL